MSNHLAIATVTAAVGSAIQDALAKDVPGANVLIGRPNGSGGQDDDPVVNLFLYQAAPNPALRNAAMPGRSASGRLVDAPIVPLDLDYLLSFYGDAAAFLPERMLGATVRALEKKPLISRAAIQKVIADNPQALAGSDLEKNPETVRIQPISLNLDEISKLWSVFFQVPYALSVAYRCSVVIVEADATGTSALPVTRPVIAPVPLGGPRIQAIEAVDGAAFPIVWGGTARLRGSGLGALGLGLRVGARDVVMAEAKVGPDAIELPLSPAAFGGGELPAGIHGVRTVLPPAPGAPAHLERTSDAAPLVLRPTLSLPQNALQTDPAPANAPVSGSLKVSFSPKAEKGQEVRLLLDERIADAGQSYVLTPEAIAEAAFPAQTLTFEFKDVKRATYLMRAQVDGVESAPDMDLDPASATYRQITGPEVVIP